MSTDTTPITVTLTDEERGDLRDWYDQSGTWHVRMAALYRAVEDLIADRLEVAWEQGWVARGNAYEVGDNPYAPDATTGTIAPEFLGAAHE